MKRVLVLIFLTCLNTLAFTQIKVACIGNSITAGGYPAQLGSILGKKWEVKNFGVSGTTMLRNGDAPYYKTKAYENAKAFQPDVVIIKLGTNDSKPQNWKYSQQYTTDYTTMINELNALPSKPFIILCYPVPAYSKGWSINDSILRNETIPMIDQVARANNLRVIDLYKPLSNHQTWFPDGIHPNNEGSAEIANVIAGKLKKWKRKIGKRKLRADS
jgi:lysophospholipase L1-like esterase